MKIDDKRTKRGGRAPSSTRQSSPGSDDQPVVVGVALIDRDPASAMPRDPRVDAPRGQIAATEDVAWGIYRRPDSVVSAGRILLAKALADYCELQWGYGGNTIADAFQHDALDDDELDALGSSMDFLAGLILDGTLKCWARPIGGGEPVRVPAALWEIDDFHPRFAISAFDPGRWHVPATRPTHWLFVDAVDFERFMEAWAATDLKDGENFESPTSRSAPVSEFPLPDEEFFRLPEVKRLTGLSRSTIYHKIGNGTFPEPTRLGTRLSMWRRSRVRAWLNDPT